MDPTQQKTDPNTQSSDQPRGSSGVNPPQNTNIVPDVEDTNPPPAPIPESFTTTVSEPTNSQPEATDQTRTPQDSIVPPSDEGAKKPKMKIAAAIVGIVLLVSSVVAGVVLVQKNQEVREKAAGSDAAHCANADGNRVEGGQTVGVCTGWQQSNNSCSGDSVNSYYFDSCVSPLGCANPGAEVQCLDATQKLEERNRGKNGVCYVNGNPAESILVAESRCGTAGPAGGTTGATTSCSTTVTPTQINKGQSVSVTLTTGRAPTNGEQHVINWGTGDSEIVHSPNAGATTYTQTKTYNTAGTYIITGSLDSPLTTPAYNTMCTGDLANRRKQLVVQDPAGAPIPAPQACAGGVTACGNANYGQLGTCSGTWTYPANSNWNNWCQANAGEVKAYCYTCTPPAGAEDVRCNLIELVNATGNVILQNEGGVAPAIKTGDPLKARVSCYTTDATDNFDKIKVTIASPAGSQTLEKVATRAQDRDRTNMHYFSAIFDLTLNTVGNYTVKAWGHTPKKAWKGKE